MNWLQMLVMLLRAADGAVSAVEKAEGKTHEQALNDVVNHLTPGAPNSPALSETEPGAPHSL